jgi:hypothetical protein
MGRMASAEWASGRIRRLVPGGGTDMFIGLLLGYRGLL